jgi:hypothetical protein
MVERFIKSKIKELGKRFKLKKDDVISANNRLTTSYIYGIDDRKVISPENKLVNSELPALNEEASLK